MEKSFLEGETMKRIFSRPIGSTTNITTPPLPPQDQNPADGTPPNSSSSTVKDYRKEYWEKLVEAALKAQRDWDKTIITLASASLGISITFSDSILGSGEKTALFLCLLAWVSWSLSLIGILFSFWTSYLSHRYGLKWLADQPTDKPLPAGETPTSCFDIATFILSALSGLLYIGGLALFVFFVILNWK
jgi:hypothetical protein